MQTVPLPRLCSTLLRMFGVWSLNGAWQVLQRKQLPFTELWLEHSCTTEEPVDKPLSASLYLTVSHFT